MLTLCTCTELGSSLNINYWCSAPGHPKSRIIVFQAGSMGVDALGKHCILGTKRHLIVIDLDQPEEVQRRIGRQSNWDVTQVQWNPCIMKKEYFATTVSC